ncbi:MAG: glucose-6-phosphate isomerase [Candidatus Muiribacteriota bacterium]
MLKYRFENMLKENVGEFGVDYDELMKIASEKSKKCHENLLKKRDKGILGFFDLPYQQEVVDKILKLKEKKKNYKNFVVIGIGGSSLGNITINNAINGIYYNKKDKNTPDIYFADNVDPEKLAQILEIINPEETLFNVITKSGSTAETMTNFMVLYNELELKCPQKVKENLIITTDREKGNLKKIADELGIDAFVIPENVGGRFSVLSPVGLISAAFTGVDIKKLLKGAADMEKKCNNSEVEKNPAYMAALIHYYLYAEKNVNINILMPYSENLASLSDWFRQLWAESLGKVDNNGNNIGITPEKAVGAIDQHSQVQLYVEGPFDKCISFIEVGEFRKKMKIPEVFLHIDGLNYLTGSSMNSLISSEKKATELALTDAKKPNETFYIPEINEYYLGQLFQLFMTMTAFAGELFEVNAFDQPGVEAGKNATYALMGRSGYENKRSEIEIKLKNKIKREI